MPLDDIEVKAALQMDVEALYARLGSELRGRAAFPLPPGELARIGRKWMQDKKSAFRAAICGSETVKAAAGKDADANVTLVSAVADLIASIVIGISPITVAVLLVRVGLNSLCSEQWRIISH